MVVHLFAALVICAAIFFNHWLSIPCFAFIGFFFEKTQQIFLVNSGW